ncbi:hypothetical protein E2C01_011344 [Portunus trituberculatus]|uniref:Uncharacterized protein n=1 Tax=Portunus trituberculatus TaxID=210409 RepID=A0A5B7DAS7_PORTR|nr:hypothetical protein [Portunus trituberculatus]
MKFLVLLGVIAAALAHPVPEPDEDCVTNVLVPGSLPYAASPTYFGYAAPAPVAYAAPAPVSYAAPAPVAYAPPAPVAYAPPAPVAYAAPAPVQLTHAEVQVPITKTHVEVPIHKQVHYGTQSYVAGSSTTIHKPALAAPAIAPPSTLLSKVSYKAPEVTVQHQEIPVEKHTPNFVETPYHAGTIVKYTAPEVKEVKVPTPVGVPHPVNVPHPVAVPTPVHSLTVHQAAVAPAVAPVAHAVQYAAVAPAVVAADDC